MTNFKFAADRLDDRDYLNGLSCSLADHMQIVWPQGSPVDIASPRDKLMWDVAQAIHALLVQRVKHLDLRSGRVDPPWEEGINADEQD